MNFNPVFDRVLVDVEPEAQKTAGGLFLAETSRSPFAVAKVLAVGPGIYQNGQLNPTMVKVDQKVTFQRGLGLEIVVEGAKYLLLREVDILAIVG